MVVNCTGVAARRFADDPKVHPLRGQNLRVANPGLERALADEEGPRALTYVIPRPHDCILGSVAVRDDWRLTPDAEATDSILARTALLEPRVAGARILEVKVGLRPGRPEVRLEAEERPEGLLVHDYGHGGAGFTLSWGCADEVVARVRERVPEAVSRHR